MRLIDMIAYRLGEKFMMSILEAKKFEPEIYEFPLDLSFLDETSEEWASGFIKTMRKDKKDGKRFTFCTVKPIEGIWNMFWATVNLRMLVKTCKWLRYCKEDGEA